MSNYIKVSNNTILFMYNNTKYIIESGGVKTLETYLARGEFNAFTYNSIDVASVKLVNNCDINDLYILIVYDPMVVTIFDDVPESVWINAVKRDINVYTLIDSPSDDIIRATLDARPENASLLRNLSIMETTSLLRRYPTTINYLSFTHFDMNDLIELCKVNPYVLRRLDFITDELIRGVGFDSLPPLNQLYGTGLLGLSTEFITSESKYRDEWLAWFDLGNDKETNQNLLYAFPDYALFLQLSEETYDFSTQSVQLVNETSLTEASRYITILDGNFNRYRARRMWLLDDYINNQSMYFDYVIKRFTGGRFGIVRTDEIIMTHDDIEYTVKEYKDTAVSKSTTPEPSKPIVSSPTKPDKSDDFKFSVCIALFVIGVLTTLIVFGEFV